MCGTGLSAPAMMGSFWELSLKEILETLEHALKRVILNHVLQRMFVDLGTSAQRQSVAKSRR